MRICALDAHQRAGVDGTLVSLAAGRKGLESWPLSWRTCLVGVLCHRDSAQKVPSPTPRKQKLKINIWLLKIRPLINQGDWEGRECRPGKNWFENTSSCNRSSARSLSEKASIPVASLPAVPFSWGLLGRCSYRSVKEGTQVPGPGPRPGLEPHSAVTPPS